MLFYRTEVGEWGVVEGGDREIVILFFLYILNLFKLYSKYLIIFIIRKK